MPLIPVAARISACIRGRRPLVPKLHLGTHSSPQLHCPASHPTKNSANVVPKIPLNPSKPPRLPHPVPTRVSTCIPLVLLTFTFFLSPQTAPACGLDWTLPQAHFEGVDDQGYVAYWEKIAQADLGDGLTIPLHIGFNSHREASSPTH